jgi:hypothetical protein
MLNTHRSNDPRLRKEILQQIVRRQTTLKQAGGKMKIRSVVGLAGLAISFALPSFAQQTRRVQK